MQLTNDASRVAAKSSNDPVIYLDEMMEHLQGAYLSVHNLPLILQGSGFPPEMVERSKELFQAAHKFKSSVEDFKKQVSVFAKNRIP